jgi:hypothetical protein
MSKKKKIERIEFSGTIDPDLYYEIKMLSLRLRKIGIKRNINELTEEGYRYILKKYYSKYQKLGQSHSKYVEEDLD